MPATNIALKHPLYPRPDLLALHTENNYPYQEKTVDKKYTRWYNKVKKKPSKITSLVTQIYRVRVLNAVGEKIMYHETLTGLDHNDNELEFDHLAGRWERPIFRKQYDEETDDVISQEIKDHETVYDIPYTADKVLELVTRGPSDSLSMVIQNGAKKWGGMYTIDEFAYAPFEALEEKGRTAKPITVELEQKTTSKQKA
jgi:hypothetical protein